MSNEQKVLLPPKRIRIEQKDVVVVPSLDSLVSDAVIVIANELAYYRGKTCRGATLGSKETIAFRGLVEALCRLTKEAREQSRAEDLGKLSNEELMDLATKVLSNKESK